MLISYAQRDPKKMPKFKATKAEDKGKSDLVAQEQVRGFFIGLALNSKSKK